MRIIESLGLQKPTAQSTYRTEMVSVECPRCGNVFVAQKRSIVSGHTKSCGCLKKDAPHMIKTLYLREAQPRLYSIWKNMRTRCVNPRIKQAKNYNLRGIKYAPEWDDYATFYAWACNAGYKDGLSIDRIDNDGDYTPSNCRWVSAKEQSKNTQLLRSTNTSGFRGVSRRKNKFVARATDGNKRVYLGDFLQAEAAALAYDAYVQRRGLGYPLNFATRLETQK